METQTLRMEETGRDKEMGERRDREEKGRLSMFGTEMSKLADARWRQNNLTVKMAASNV